MKGSSLVIGNFKADRQGRYREDLGNKDNVVGALGALSAADAMLSRKRTRVVGDTAMCVDHGGHLSNIPACIACRFLINFLLSSKRRRSIPVFSGCANLDRRARLGDGMCMHLRRRFLVRLCSAPMTMLQ